jgi:hypothetical protein
VIAGALLLWRGQKLIPHDPRTALFRTEGILSRLPAGGDPTYVTRVGIWGAAQHHVKPVGMTEEQFYRTSSFLSFSESRDTALRFAVGNPPRELLPCPEYFEEAVLFELDITARRDTGTPGVFLLQYFCDYDLVRPNLPTEDEAYSALEVSCEYCAEKRRLHTLLLINVSHFLKAYPNSGTRQKALEYAISDQEWLVYPIDPIARLKSDHPHDPGYEGRLPVSPIWRYHLYRFR